MTRKKGDKNKVIDIFASKIFIVFFQSTSKRAYPICAFKTRKKAELYIYDVEERWNESLADKRLFAITLPYFSSSHDITNNIKIVQQAVNEQIELENP